MKQVNRLGWLWMAVWASVAVPTAGWCQDFSKIPVRIDRVAGSVYVVTGAGGNIGVLAGADGLLLVDSQFAELREKIVGALATVDPGPVRFVLNTNWHYDHASGNEAFHAAGATIVAHANCTMRMAHDQPHAVIGSKTAAYPAGARPAITFQDSLRLHLDGEEVEAVHIPGAHSDADILVRFPKANVIHTGDLFFSAGYPYIDIGNGGSIDGMIAAVTRILAMSDGQTRFIPGHGPVGDRARLEAFRAMLVEVRGRVARLAAAGKTEAEAIAAKPTADLDTGWRGAMPADQFVALVYRSLPAR